MNRFNVDQDSPLLAYLFAIMPKRSKKDVKNLLSKKMILVNNQIQTQFNYPLKKGDVISIGQRQVQTHLDILYEDQELIVINKPSGLLSMASEKEKEKTAYHQVRQYLKEKDPKAMIFIVHRLDQFTSGVLMFAKNEKIKNMLQEKWNDIVTKRGYLAIVEGEFKKKQGTIQSYLKETKTQMVYSSHDQTGKLAITHYQVQKSNSRYSLLEIYLDTGRKNQIRVHMQDLHHPIAGDTKYKAKTNPIGRLGLHSHILELIHPVTQKKMTFEAAMPESFKRLF